MRTDRTRYMKKPPAVHPNTLLWVPGVQPVGSGAAIDKSSNGRNLAVDVGTTDGAVWANPGWITTTDGSGGSAKGVSTAAIMPPVDFRSDTVLLCMQVKGAATAAADVASKRWGGTFPAGGGGVQFRLSGTVGNGKMRLALFHSGSPTISADSALTVFDGNPHSLQILVRGGELVAEMYVDGVKDTGVGSMSLSGMGLTAGAHGPFCLGHDVDAAGQGNRAVQFANIQWLQWNGQAPPANIATLLAMYVQRPWDALRAV